MILWPNFSLAAQVLVEEFFGIFMTICPGGTNFYQNSIVFCFLTTKDKKLTIYTKTNCWLASKVFTTNTCQSSSQMSQLIKIQSVF